VTYISGNVFWIFVRVSEIFSWELNPLTQTITSLLPTVDPFLLHSVLKEAYNLLIFAMASVQLTEERQMCGLHVAYFCQVRYDRQLNK